MALAATPTRRAAKGTPGGPGGDAAGGGSGTGTSATALGSAAATAGAAAVGPPPTTQGHHHHSRRRPLSLPLRTHTATATAATATATTTRTLRELLPGRHADALPARIWVTATTVAHGGHRRRSRAPARRCRHSRHSTCRCQCRGTAASVTTGPRQGRRHHRRRRRATRRPHPDEGRLQVCGPLAIHRGAAVWWPVPPARTCHRGCHQRALLPGAGGTPHSRLLPPPLNRATGDTRSRSPHRCGTASVPWHPPAPPPVPAVHPASSMAIRCGR